MLYAREGPFCESLGPQEATNVILMTGDSLRLRKGIGRSVLARGSIAVC